MRKRVVILISGSGSNMLALLDAVEAQQINADIAAVISNQADAAGLQKAAARGIHTEILPHKHFPDRAVFDQELIKLINSYQPDLVVLAGFMRILTPEFVTHFAGKLLNIHPSLLPKYRGLHTHQRALDAGDNEHGCSIHFVTAELDGGPVVAQARVPVFTDDTAASLAQRVQIAEHQLYPLCVQWFCSGELQADSNNATLNGLPLPAEGIQFRLNHANTLEKLA
ncbi:MAG TPA: phosphoribosylglycinamide formyltransferase [Pseudomonadales bacterium]|nr:phosphoribosylglycinamide formyltransferase [Pseudomonadales bacterium]